LRPAIREGSRYVLTFRSPVLLSLRYTLNSENKMNASDFKYTATTPKSITEPIRQFCHELSTEEPVVLDVCPDAFADQGRCYINATQVAERFGGRVVFGWLVWELAGIYVTAEHHAVVEIDGKMIDVTPPFAGEHKVVFVPDAITEYRSQIIPNRYASLVASELIARYVEIAARNSALFAAGKGFGDEYNANDREMTGLLDLYLSRLRNGGDKQVSRKKKKMERMRKKQGRRMK
jgi:hypothetical protein